MDSYSQSGLIDYDGYHLQIAVIISVISPQANTDYLTLNFGFVLDYILVMSLLTMAFELLSVGWIFRRKVDNFKDQINGKVVPVRVNLIKTMPKIQVHVNSLNLYFIGFSNIDFHLINLNFGQHTREDRRVES